MDGLPQTVLSTGFIQAAPGIELALSEVVFVRAIDNTDGVSRAALRMAWGLCAFACGNAS